MYFSGQNCIPVVEDFVIVSVIGLYVIKVIGPGEVAQGERTLIATIAGSHRVSSDMNKLGVREKRMQDTHIMVITEGFISQSFFVVVGRYGF